MASIYSYIGFYLSLTKKDQRSVFLGKVFGYLFSKNSSTEKSEIYQYIWNTAAQQDFNEVQTKKFFSSFQEGKTMKDDELEKLFFKCKNLWKDNASQLSLFNQLVVMLFFDNVITQKEKNTFFRIARYMDINDSTRNVIFDSYVKKYHLEFDEDSNNYFGNI